MDHIAAARAAALALLTFAGVGAATESSARADKRCTEALVNVDEMNRQVTVSFHNSCQEHVSCRVQWTLKCGGKGRGEDKSEELRIDGHGDNAVVASALSCGDADWRINPPRWRCDEPDETPTIEHSSGKKKKRR
jgi:hypothetical protein